MSEATIARQVAAVAQVACLLEASAPKPGNVSPGRPFADLGYEDFLVSAVAIGEPLAGAGDRPLGATIRLAVEASARWTRTNTNLGIVLLLAPLVRAVLQKGKGVGCHFPRTLSDNLERTPDPFFRDALRQVLATTTVDDARDVYAAIRCASPGGLGRVADQDVAGTPTLTLVEVMQLAADRDGIAREYATAFEVTFETAVPALAQARSALSWDDSIVETFLTVLAANPDTHIARRGGVDLAREVSARARTVLEAGGVRSDRGRGAIAELDRLLRDDRHLGNPGTTADLTAAATFVVLVEGGWGDAGRAR